jgi:hypothetical protein
MWAQRPLAAAARRGSDTVWHTVAGFCEAEADEVAGAQFLSDFRELSRESGSVILFSRRRRKLSEREP